MLTQQKHTSADGDATAMWAEAQTTALAEHFKGEWQVPAYGSAEWQQMAAADPRRAAAVIEAAELWRRHVAEQYRLAQLAEDDPDAWHAEVTAPADAYARRIAQTLASNRTAAELNAARAKYPPPRPVQATPGWPPIAIPGRPGWRRHYRAGKQIDLNTNERRTVAA